MKTTILKITINYTLNVKNELMKHSYIIIYLILINNYPMVHDVV